MVFLNKDVVGMKLKQLSPLMALVLIYKAFIIITSNVFCAWMEINTVIQLLPREREKVVLSLSY